LSIGINPTTGGGAALHPTPGATVLLLSLKKDEKILIGDKIIVKVIEIRGKQIRLGIEAPDDVLILRESLAKKGETKE
jgi:carbon storage regulator